MLDWLRRRFASVAHERPSQAVAEPVVDEPVQPAPNETQLGTLEQARGTPAEAAAIQRALAEHERGVLAPPDLLRLAAVLAARGDTQLLLRLGQGRPEPAIQLLCADALADSGDAAQALLFCERALAFDIEYPGARERHARWSRNLHALEAASDGPTLLVPERVPSTFRILREAGRGGTATVYEATEPLLTRQVALKLYHRPVSDREQLLREARTAAQFAGPGLIRVYDVQPEAGYLVLEWASGGSIKRALQGQVTDWLVPIESWFWPLVEALARLHAAGWVHADVKPANLLLTAPGHVALSDFGLSAEVGTQAWGGTPGYAPPERGRDPRLRPSDDVYAVGRVLSDVLDLVAESTLGTRASYWRRLAALCAEQTGSRPSDARALLGQRPLP